MFCQWYNADDLAILLESWFDLSQAYYADQFSDMTVPYQQLLMNFATRLRLNQG